MDNKWTNGYIYFYISHLLPSLGTFLFVFPVCFWVESQKLWVWVLVTLLEQKKFSESYSYKLTPWKPFLAELNFFEMCLRASWYIILCKRKKKSAWNRYTEVLFTPWSLHSQKFSILVSIISISSFDFHPNWCMDVWRALRTHGWTLWVPCQCLLLLFGEVCYSVNI